MRDAANYIAHGTFVAVATAMLGVGIYSLLTAGLATFPRVTIAALGGFGLVAAAYATGAAAQNLRNGTSTTDLVQTTVNKSQFDERSAVGTVDGQDVLVTAALGRYEHPTLSVLVGGEHFTPEEDEIGYEYTGGVSQSRTYDDVTELLEDFSELAERYDLTVQDVATEDETDGDV